ncbi:MAG: hypothetical protein A2066_13995 [Bacteroidetes bacterium GWB2_41_8]|nr:MAG: hypothetical protein A2066_13995 [Bacteroidetes bacterium GWB2_41_8]
MDNRLLKDIRFFEIKPDDYHGKFDGMIGNIYKNSPDTKYIGQRIARKLNEFGFISGEFDHIYINLSQKLNDNEIKESSVFLDKQIKYYDYGLQASVFNNLTDYEKDAKIKEITFKVLNRIYKNDDLKIQLIKNVSDLTDKYDKCLLIKYKTKETSQYRIDLSFQIRPNDDKSKLITEYTDKKENKTKQKITDILDYEDLYSLVDKVVIKDGLIIFQPKKSYHAELVAGKYKNQSWHIEIKNMTNNK